MATTKQNNVRSGSGPRNDWEYSELEPVAFFMKMTETYRCHLCVYGSPGPLRSALCAAAVEKGELFGIGNGNVTFQGQAGQARFRGSQSYPGQQYVILLSHSGISVEKDFLNELTKVLQNPQNGENTR